MNRILQIIILLLAICPMVKAQKVVRFVDVETEKPVAYVTIADKDSVICKANEEGIAFIPLTKGNLIFIHDSYDRIEMPYEEVSQVILLFRRTQQIDEVVVIGQGDSNVDRHAVDVQLDKTDAQLIAAGSGQGNLFSFFSKLFRSKKQRRLERTKKALDRFDQH